MEIAIYRIPRSLLVWPAILCSTTLLAAQPVSLDRFGGVSAVQLPASGFFRAQQDQNRWWLVTPQGHPFFSVGVCCVRFEGEAEKNTGRFPYRENVLKKYGSVEAWTAITRGRLKQWGFNTLAAWSAGEIKDLPRTITLNFCSQHWLNGGLPDFFDPAFETNAAAIAQQCRPTQNDPWLIGYFLDNELQWARDWRAGPSLFNRFLALPASAPGKKALVRFFKDRYGTVGRFNKTWTPIIPDWSCLEKMSILHPIGGQKARDDADAFTLLAARQYFKVTTRAVRRADPHHLILGCRFIAWTVPAAVVRACGEFCDVVSLNYYELGPLGSIALALSPTDIPRVAVEPDLKNFYRLAGKPLLVTEFSFRAKDSGMPNTFPPPLVVQPLVTTQTERAKKYQDYAATWAAAPYVLGFHWFQYADEPKAGRFDGECGNYGLVNIADEPYTPFLDQIAPFNLSVPKRHTRP